jgi:hypothetical protein
MIKRHQLPYSNPHGIWTRKTYTFANIEIPCSGWEQQR